MLEFARNYIFSLIDGIVACFTMNLSWKYLCTTFWFLIFVEFPRYYLLDLIVWVHYGCTWRSRRAKRAIARRMLYAERPLVSVIAPGKNEGQNIYKLVRSLREQTYDNYELIIVDDGSDDATPLICRDLEKHGYISRYFRMEQRGGKASAANYAVYHSRGKYIVHIDADGSLDRDAIEKILLPFYMDRKVKGVGGCIKVRNADDTLCTKMQSMEYMKTIQLGRMGVDLLGLYHIISGAFGAFDAETLREVGCWDIGPGLDGDLTQKLRKGGYKVAFAHDAICMTSVPVRWSALYKQRKRWAKSLVRFRMRKHADVLKPNRNFSIINFLSNLENMLYDCYFNYVWIIYMITLIFANTDRLLDVLIVGWIIRMGFVLMSYIVMQCVTERPLQERDIALYLPLHTFYTGWFLRVCRLVAHTEEILFRTSYRDPWNPPKTSNIARYENI